MTRAWALIIIVTLYTHNPLSPISPPPPPPPDVTLEHDADHLYLTATRSGQHDKSDRYASRHESWTGSSTRTIYVGANFDLANMSQSFEHGNLKIKIPRVAGSRKLVNLL